FPTRRSSDLALIVLVAIQLFVPGLYLPPVFNWKPTESPPQTIISLPVQIAVWAFRPSGALVVLVAVQLFVLGSYVPPVSREPNKPNPPQTIILVPVHTAV